MKMSQLYLQKIQSYLASMIRPAVVGVVLAVGLSGCVGASQPARRGTFSLAKVADVDLPGNATRFDYQDVDADAGRLVVAHMGDNELLVIDLATGATLGRLNGLDTPRGVLSATSINRYFATVMTDELVMFDTVKLTEVGRARTGKAPDGLAYDSGRQIVAVSAQHAGGLTLLPAGGMGAAQQVPLGVATGNVVYDDSRGRFWVTVETEAAPDQLVGVESATGAVSERLGLPGCDGAHGLRLHPDGRSAYVACEGNDQVVRVDLGTHALVKTGVGHGVDVMAIDVGLGLLYVAAESGELVVIDTTQPGLNVVGREQVGAAAHSVAVDQATHRVFFPLMAGPRGTPVLRILRPGA